MVVQKTRSLSTQINGLFRLVNTFLHSVRFRLALWFVLILGIVVMAFSIFIYYRQLHDLRTAAEDRLEFRTQKIRGLFRNGSHEFFEGTPFQIPGDPISEASVYQEGEILTLITPDGQIAQNWGPLQPDGIRQIASQDVQKKDEDDSRSPSRISIVVPGKHSRVEYILLFTPLVNEGDRLGYLLLGDPVDPDNSLPRLLATLVLGGMTTLGFALVGGVWLADRAIRPVKTITQTAHRIGETDLSLRLNLNRRDELGELANTFDEMLTRLESAFARQRQFTADASHELRTPLTIVELEASRALEAQRSAHEYQRALSVIRAENSYMTRLVNNLLTLARMDAGQVVLSKQELDLSDLALEVVERLAPLAKKNGVRLVVGDLPELPVLGDRQYLIQLLTNLVENAIKYSSGEEKQVEIQSGLDPELYPRMAWARVTDHGPGIPPEHLPHLFDRFYQVDKARTQTVSVDPPFEEEAVDRLSSSGSGLGLSIARWIAHAHGGEIVVQSEYGRGSSFEVRLPLAGG